MKTAKQKVLKKKSPKKTVKKKKLTEEELFQKEMEKDFDDDDFDATMSEQKKPLLLDVVVNNGSDIIFRDVQSKFLYALETSEDTIFRNCKTKKYNLSVLGIYH